MNKYIIRYSFDAKKSVSVLASSEVEAMIKARETILRVEDFDMTLYEETVQSQEPIDDLTELIRKASEIVFVAEEIDKYITLSPWPTVSIPMWDGEQMKPNPRTIESIHWDYDRDEIGIDDEEIVLSDLPDIDQYELCKQILETAKKGGLI